VHEENSNFQKDNLYIFKLKILKGNKIKIIFSNDIKIAVVKDVIIRENIFEGKEVSPDTPDQLKSISDSLEAEKYAISLLSYRQYSKKALGLKLIKRGYASECIEKLIHKLEDLRYLDDTEFAKTWVASRIIRHPEGKNLLLAGLLRQGIERNIALYVIQELISLEKEVEMAAEIYKKLKKLQKSEEKIRSTLHARGFPYNVIRKIMGY